MHEGAEARLSSLPELRVVALLRQRWWSCLAQCFDTPHTKLWMQLLPWRARQGLHLHFGLMLSVLVAAAAVTKQIHMWHQPHCAVETESVYLTAYHAMKAFSSLF